MENDPQYTTQNPDLKGFDLEAMNGLGAHSDGSGGGILWLAWEMGKLREVRERIDLLDAFVRKYQLTLARLSWELYESRIHPVKKQGAEKDIGVFVPSIEVCSYAYDKRRDVTAKDIAALWPDAQWRRSMPRYSCDEETVRDYTADIDGVLVRITNAERKQDGAEGLPQSSAVSPVKADGLATYWRKRALAAEDLIERQQIWLEVQTKPEHLQSLKENVDLLRSQFRRKRISRFCADLWPIHTPESEQGENAGDGKLSQGSPEADATPSNRSASGRRND